MWLLVLLPFCTAAIVGSSFHDTVNIQLVMVVMVVVLVVVVVVVSGCALWNADLIVVVYIVLVLINLCTFTLRLLRYGRITITIYTQSITAIFSISYVYLATAFVWLGVISRPLSSFVSSLNQDFHNVRSSNSLSNAYLCP